MRCRQPVIGCRLGRVAAGALLLGGCYRPPVPAALQPGVRYPKPPAVPAGQSAVIGVVADSATGYPVRDAMAYVTLDSAGIMPDPPRLDPALPVDRTDGGGGFVLVGLPPGRHALAVRSIGYYSARRFVVLHPGSVDTVIVRLQGRR